MAGWDSGAVYRAHAAHGRVRTKSRDAHTEALDGGLFEIRAKGREGIGQAFYCARKGQHLVILHEFIKKSQKTPKRELRLARKRMKEIDR